MAPIKMALSNKKLSFSLAALGVVYGDIGTSPLYALRQALDALPLTPTNVLGVLSLIFWALILVISTQYLSVVLRADNEGEGGVLALLALLKKQNLKSYAVLLVLGIFGAGLLFGDGMLTPAISVVSAVQGLQVISPSFHTLVLPITVIILLVLFLGQRFGTARIGFLFGPFILCWFIVLGVLGIINILQNPVVLNAINPYYAFKFFQQNKLEGYILLSGVFLVITGAEALYADLGHFGAAPIRWSWFCVVLPGLILNYFGQGAHLLLFPDAISNPFYTLAPDWFTYPLVIIASIATIIASQAVISASFSLANQAMLLDLLPRLQVKQTSEEERGQVYVPQINIILAVGTISLILFFQNADKLANAYGIAVNLVMLIVSILVICVARLYWHWSISKVIKVFTIFTLIELSFLGANLHKVMAGGWIPLLFALFCVFIMLSWHKGVQILRSVYYKNKVALQDILEQLSLSNLNSLPNFTTIFITDPFDQSGGGFLHYLKLNRIMPELILIVSIQINQCPYVSEKECYEVSQLHSGIYRIILHFGFMQSIDIPKALFNAQRMAIFPFTLDMDHSTFLIEMMNIVITKKTYPNAFLWPKSLFAFLLRNSSLDIEFFNLPYNKTITIGTHCEI